MRIIVFFDLPTVTPKDRKEYFKFRKFLLKEGFIMLQESVYSKIALNGVSSNLVSEKIKKASPAKGNIQILIITEKQFASIEYICGFKQKTIIDSTERLVIF